MQLGRYAAMQLFRNKCFHNGATVFCVVGTQEFRNDFSTSLSSWFQSALNKNALPVPMLRQVLPDRRLADLYLTLLTWCFLMCLLLFSLTVSKMGLSGSMFSRVFIAILEQLLQYSHVFIAISPFRIRGVPQSGLLVVLGGPDRTIPVCLLQFHE